MKFLALENEVGSWMYTSTLDAHWITPVLKGVQWLTACPLSCQGYKRALAPGTSASHPVHSFGVTWRDAKSGGHSGVMGWFPPWENNLPCPSCQLSGWWGGWAGGILLGLECSWVLGGFEPWAHLPPTPSDINFCLHLCLYFNIWLWSIWFLLFYNKSFCCFLMLIVNG